MDSPWTAADQEDFERWLTDVYRSGEVIENLDTYADDLVYEPEDCEARPFHWRRIVPWVRDALRRLREFPVQRCRK